MGELNPHFPKQIDLPDGIVASQIPLSDGYVNDNVRYAFIKGGMNIGSAMFTYDDVNKVYRPTAFVGVQVNEKFRGKGVYSSLVKSMGKHFPVGSTATEYTPEGEVIHTTPSAARAWQRAGASKKPVLPNPKLSNSWVKEIYVISPSDYLASTTARGVPLMADPAPSSIFPPGFVFPDNRQPAAAAATATAAASADAPVEKKKRRRRGNRSGAGKNRKAGIKATSKKLGMMKRVRGAFGRMGMPGLIAGTALSAVAFPILERLIYGSREQQMRDQFELQKKLEMEEMSKMGGMGGMASGPMDDRSMYQLISEEADSRKDLGFAMGRNHLMSSLGRNQSGDELARLLAGDEARIRSAMAPRQLTPYEVMGMLDG